MNLIFKAGVIVTLIFIPIIGIIFRQTHFGWMSFEKQFIKTNHTNKLKWFLQILEEGRGNTLLRNRLVIALNIFLLSTLAAIKIIQPDLFYYALPCIVFLILVLNMDWILKTRRNSDFVGEAAIGYLIFISYLLFIVLFLFLITIYFKSSDTSFHFV